MERGISVQQMVKGLWRRRRLVLLVFALVLAGGVFAVAAVPSVYRATTVVRVDPHRPSPELVQPSLTSPVEEGLRIARQELLARPVLEQAVKELELFKSLREKKGMDAAVERLRLMLDVTVEGERAYVLSVEGRDAALAARIANRVPAIHAQQTMEARAGQARTTAALLAEELGRIEGDVRAIEQRIAAFKAEHLGELPEQLEANMRGLERALGEATARSDARRELQRRLVELERSRADADTELGRLQRRELDLSAAVVAGRSQWTEDHPEMQRLTRELAEVRARHAEAEARTRVEDGERGFLRGQLRVLTADIEGLERLGGRYRERIDRTPRWAQELTVFERDYELLRGKYQSLLSRKIEAEVARDLEEKAGTSTFHVLSEATVPSAPYKPDRPAGVLLSLLVALAAGLLAGVFRELHDDSVRHAEHARELSMQVLAQVPRIGRR